MTTSTTRATRLAQTAVYYIAFVALGLASASLGPTLGGLAEHTRTRLNEISFLFMARSLGYLAGSFVGGRVYDRWPGHMIMAGILVAMAVVLALAPMMPLLWLLTAVLLVLGMGEGALDVGGNILLMWVHRSEVGPFMNGLHFAWGLGASLSPIIVAQAVLRTGDITWAYWTLAVLMLPVIIGLLRLPSPATGTSLGGAGAVGATGTGGAGGTGAVGATGTSTGGAGAVGAAGTGGTGEGGVGGAGAVGGAGGLGGSASSESMAAATTGNGGIGGNGGDALGGNAGTFNASNSIDGSLSNSAGIVTISQNSGMNSLTQQGITVQANLTVQ